MKIRGFRSDTDEDSSLCDVTPRRLVKLATFRRMANPWFSTISSQRTLVMGGLEELWYSEMSVAIYQKTWRITSQTPLKYSQPPPRYGASVGAGRFVAVRLAWLSIEILHKKGISVQTLSWGLKVALYRGEGAPYCGLIAYLLTDMRHGDLVPPAFVQPCEKVPPVVNGIPVR